MVRNSLRVLETQWERQERKIMSRFKSQTFQWFLLKHNFHTLCTSSQIDLLQNFPCQAEGNSLIGVGEMRDIPLNTSQVPAGVQPRQPHLCVRARVTGLRSLCHRAQLHP